MSCKHILLLIHNTTYSNSIPHHKGPLPVRANPGSLGSLGEVPRYVLSIHVEHIPARYRISLISGRNVFYMHMDCKDLLPDFPDSPDKERPLVVRYAIAV